MQHKRFALIRNTDVLRMRRSSTNKRSATDQEINEVLDSGIRTLDDSFIALRAFMKQLASLDAKLLTDAVYSGGTTSNESATIRDMLSKIMKRVTDAYKEMSSLETECRYVKRDVKLMSDGVM